MNEDNRHVVEQKTNTDIYVMIKIVSVLLCLGIFAIFFYAKKFIFVSDYDLVAKRAIFRNPSELKDLVNAGAFWTYFNRGLAFFFLMGGIVHILTSACSFISQKIRALADIIISLMLTVSLPLYFLIACIVSKSRVKFSSVVVVFIIFIVIEALITVYFSRRYIRDNKSFTDSSNRLLSMLAGILFIIIPLLPLGLGIKAIGLANDYYKENPYEIFDRSGVIDPNEAGNYLNRAAVLGDDVYMCSANTVFKIDGQGHVSEVFKPDGYVGYMQACDGKIFYALTEFKREICCYDLASGENTLIFSDDDMYSNIRLFYIKGGKLYFAIHNTELYCVDTNDISSAPEVVFHDMLDVETFQYYTYYGLSFDELRDSAPYYTNKMIPYDGSLYLRQYVPNNTGKPRYDGIYSLDLWEKTEKDGSFARLSPKTILANMEQFNIYDGIFYYTNYKDHLCYLYKADLNAENAELISAFEKDPYSLAVTADHIYVCFYDGVAIVNR